VQGRLSQRPLDKWSSSAGMRCPDRRNLTGSSMASSAARPLQDQKGSRYGWQRAIGQQLVVFRLKATLFGDLQRITGGLLTEMALVMPRTGRCRVRRRATCRAQPSGYPCFAGSSRRLPSDPWEAG
jgi:hypothetical protein